MDNKTRALFTAVSEDSQEFVDISIETGANVNGSTRDIVTPLFYAVSGKSPKCVKSLLKARADVNGKWGSCSLLFARPPYINKRYIDNILLHEGIKDNVKDNDSLTALTHFLRFRQSNDPTTKEFSMLPLAAGDTVDEYRV